jgi:hypothetical protein
MIVIDCCFVIGASTKTAKQPNIRQEAPSQGYEGEGVLLVETVCTSTADSSPAGGVLEELQNAV